LVAEGPGAGGTTALPASDASGSIAIGAANGKVALINSETALSGNCPSLPVVDLVGYGTANCFETTVVPALSNTTAAVRKNNGCIDTDNNSNDFLIVGPIPRNSQSPANFCGAAGQLSGQGLAVPNSIPAGNTLLTVSVTPATG